MKDDGGACFTIRIPSPTYVRLAITWSDNNGKNTESFHRNRNEAEIQAIEVLRASGNNSKGRVCAVSIMDHIGNMPENNPHGI